NDQRIGRRPPLGREDASDCAGARGIGAEAVDGLGRECDQAAAAQDLHCSGELNHGGSVVFLIPRGEGDVRCCNMTSHYGSVMRCSASHALAASASEQIRKTSCTVP